MVSKTFSSCVEGFKGTPVIIEASKQNSLPQIQITGLPNTVVQESRERIRASLNSLGYKIPSKKLLVHLSPAETKKNGSQFDLPIAMALLTSEGFYPGEKLLNFAFLGELNLSGELKPIHQLIPLVESLLAFDKNLKIIIPQGNQEEASLLPSNRVFLCRHLSEVIQCIFGNGTLPSVPSPVLHEQVNHTPPITLDSLVGQEYQKRVLVLAISGGHPLLLEGPPGSGKTLLSLSAQSLLPQLTAEESLEVSRIYSFFGETRIQKSLPPFRMPHHSVSASAFLGGGNAKVIPGELSLAHRGILFLDELPEFRRDAIEGLREPLQSGEIHLHRIGQSLRLPADFDLIASMNPCPCGYFGSKTKACQCSPEMIRSYRKKLSGPILDRFPLYLWMETTPSNNFSATDSAPKLRDTVKKVRAFLKEKQLLRASYIELLPFLSGEGKDVLDQFQKLEQLSFRKTLNLVRLGFTLALLDGRELILPRDLEESWSLKAPESLL